ncbi:glycosyltransferase family 4 protein [Prochlorococcus sp. AH-736-K09]|nr:glycosyltransferase family 4 protein [Prochlorococcus sp. AH-736-K09]
MRKIYIYNFSYTNGGQEKYINYLEDHFLLDKVEFEIIKMTPSLKNLLKPINYPYKLSPNYQIVEILNGNAALYFRGALPRNKNVKKIYIQHSSFKDNQSGYLKIILRFLLFFILLKNMKSIIRVSDNSLPSFFSKDKIKTIYNGVPLENIKYNNKSPLNKKHLKLLMVGTVNKNKNQKLAIDILRSNHDLILTIVGDGELKQELINKNLDLIKSGRLLFTGQQKNIRKYYLSSHILLVLSNNEGLPFVMLEAMSYGLPVIATNVGGIPEVIKNKENGYLIEKNDFNSIINTINNLKINNHIYKYISKNAKKTIISKFTTLHMYNNLMKDIDGFYK